MQVNSTNVTVGDVNQILLSLGGVIQKPGTDFTVSSSTLTFTTAPAANTSFFAILLGSDNGGTVTPTDGSVTSAKIAADNVTPPKTNFFNTDPGNAADLGMLHIKSGDSGASVSSTSDELVIEGSSVGMSFLDATDGATRIAFGDSGDNDIGKIVYGHSSNQMEFVTNAATGLVIDGSGHVTKPLQSAFSVHKNGTDQSNMAIATTTVTWAAERFDQNADFNLTDNNFVAPVTGKYFLNFMARLEAVDTGAAYYVVSIITSNASYRYIIDPNFSADLNYFKIQVTVLADMDASDTAHIEFVQNSGTAQTDIDGDATETFFMGHLVA
jgi:hypothetical protein